MPDLAPDANTLRKRVLRLLGLDNGAPRRNELQQRILPWLRNFGEVALIGGAIRDIARAGRRGFKSDLDFVVHSGSPENFRALMVECKAKPNRFGGYGVAFDRWKVDVWHIHDTWARTAGYRQVEALPDLLECTFFNWDSVLFDLTSRQLVMRGDYLNVLRQNVMDLQLEQNPNPTGSLVRALRRAALWGVHFGPALSDFAREELARRSWNELVELDVRAFSHPVLVTMNEGTIRRRLDDPFMLAGMSVTSPIGGPPTQLRFDISEDATIPELRLPA